MEGFTFTAVITGIVCYVLGLGFGWFVNRSGNATAVREAYRKGEEGAQKVHEEEKQELSEELLERLEQMKDSLVSTYEAYEDAVQSVDQKLSPGVKEKLTLAHPSSESQPQLSYEEEGASSQEEEEDFKKKESESTLETFGELEEADAEPETGQAKPRDIDSEDPGEVMSSESPYGSLENGSSRPRL